MLLLTYECSKYISVSVAVVLKLNISHLHALGLPESIFFCLATSFLAIHSAVDSCVENGSVQCSHDRMPDPCGTSPICKVSCELSIIIIIFYACKFYISLCIIILVVR